MDYFLGRVNYVWRIFCFIILKKDDDDDVKSADNINKNKDVMKTILKYVPSSFDIVAGGGRHSS